jgi:ubiquinone biosynthesis protein COQ9
MDNVTKQYIKDHSDLMEYLFDYVDYELEELNAPEITIDMIKNGVEAYYSIQEGIKSLKGISCKTK